MPIVEFPPQEQFADLRFPLQGIDTSDEFMLQRQGTTPVGHNVRAFEELTLRGRGGQRAGLSKYIPVTVTGAGPSLIQHINSVIDPQADSLLIDTNPITGEPYTAADTIPVGGNPALAVADPQIDGYYVRNGGSAIQPNKAAIQKRKGITFYQAASGSSPAIALGTPAANFSITLPKPVKIGDLLVLVAYVQSQPLSNAPSNITVTDSLSNTYHLINSNFIGNPASTSPNAFMFYAIAQFGGTGTVNITLDANSWDAVATALEYKNVSSISPVDGSNTNGSIPDTPPMTPISPGLVPVTMPAELVLTMYGFEAFVGGTFAPVDPQTTIASSVQPSDLFSFLCVTQLLGAATPQTPSAQSTVDMFQWLAIGASFEQR